MKCMLSIGPHLKQVLIGALIVAGMTGLLALGSDQTVNRVLDMLEKYL